MGGSASVTLLPLANDCLQRVADVARNVPETNSLFNKIALHGKNCEEILHPKLGKKDDSLCFTEIMQYIAKDKGFFYQNFTTKPVVIIKESYCHCFMGSGQDMRENLYKKLSRSKFRLFLLTLFFNSRLWEIFNANKDEALEEKFHLHQLMKRKGIHEQVCSRVITWLNNWKGDYFGCVSEDEMYSAFIDFSRYCVSNILTPEEYFRLLDQGAASTAHVDKSLALHSVCISDGPERLNCGSHVEISNASEDIDISAFSLMNRSFSLLWPNRSPDSNVEIMDDITPSISHDINDDLNLNVEPLKPEYTSSHTIEMSPALCSLYGARISNNYSPKSGRKLDRVLSAGNKYNSRRTFCSDTQQPSSRKQIVQKLNSKSSCVTQKPQRDWHALNKKRGIIHHPEVDSPRAIYVTELEQPVKIKPFHVCKTLPLNNRIACHNLSRPVWTRAKRKEKGPLWKPRHVISNCKKKISTIRTVKM